VVEDLYEMQQVLEVVGFTGYDYDAGYVGRNKIRSSRLISTRTPVENDSRRKRFASCAMDYFMFDFAPPSECVEGGVLDFSKANEQNTSEHGYSYLQDRGGL
jgi:hypothetical protein